MLEIKSLSIKKEFYTKKIFQNVNFISKEGTPERKLMEKFYNIIILGRNVKVRSDNSVEGLISIIISKKSGDSTVFTTSAFRKTLGRSGSGSFENIIDRYELLFRLNEKFIEKDKNLLLKAIKTYKKDKGLVDIETIDYSLIKTIQESYFIEHKKYLTLPKLSSEVTGRYHTLTDHFSQKNAFSAYIIFQFECWARKNLSGKHLKKIQDKIDELRSINNDNSVYAVQDTSIRKISYSILILYYQVIGKTISIYTLDALLRERFGNTFAKSFFGDRLKPKYERMGYLSEIEDSLKIFLKEKFQSKAPKETKLLINLIDDYNKIPRKFVLKSHSLYQGKIKTYQLKILIDITKGLDPLDCIFFTNEELDKSGKKGGITIHHIDEDPNYEFLFYVFLDGEEYRYKFKLVPLKFLESHIKVHSSLHFSSGAANDLVEARMRHLYQLEKMSYYKNLPLQNYIDIFKESFKYKKDFILKYGKEVSVWNEFEDGKIKGMNDDTIEKFVERWVYFKDKGELSWYNNHYKEFYQNKYLSFIERLKAYTKESLNGKYSPFFEWFLNVYLTNEIFP